MISATEITDFKIKIVTGEEGLEMQTQFFSEYKFVSVPNLNFTLDFVYASKTFVDH